jgi:hypothetical protein
VAVPAGATRPTTSRPYPVSPRGGTPAIGPGDKYNACERIWCLAHGENFFVDHFLTGHEGWVIHDDGHGDVFVPRHRSGGLPFPHAAPPALLFCGQHAHPFLLGRGAGPIKLTGYNRALGYGREHFARYGTRLEPCCINGLGWSFLHSKAGRQFRFHDTAEYRENPEIGWAKPFPAKSY